MHRPQRRRFSWAPKIAAVSEDGQLCWIAVRDRCRSCSHRSSLRLPEHLSVTAESQGAFSPTLLYNICHSRRKVETFDFLYCLGQACEWTIFSKLGNSKSVFLFNAIKIPQTIKSLHLFANVQCFLQQRTSLDVTHLSTSFTTITLERKYCTENVLPYSRNVLLIIPYWLKQMESFPWFYSRSIKDISAKAEHPNRNYSPIEKKSQLKLALKFPV